MPFQIQVDATILRITFSGHVTDAEFINSLIELQHLERGLGHVPDRLTDLTAVQEWEPKFSTTLDVTKARRSQVFPNHFRSAIVAPAPETFGVARMFQTLNDNPQIAIQVFETLTAAEGWLAANVK
jgi:hypothetical protein